MSFLKKETLKILDSAERAGILKEMMAELDPTVRGEALAVHDDLEYFRTKPAKNWRIRATYMSEEVLIKGRIAPLNNQILVFRQRQVDNGLVFFKVSVTTGPYNDLADPWIAMRYGALRASECWKHFVATTLEHQGHDVLLVALDQASEDTKAFERWCLEDIERTARLSWAICSDSPQLKDFDLDELFNGTENFDTVVTKLPPDTSESTLSVLAGYQLWTYWGTHSRIALVPDRPLLDALVDQSFEDVPFKLPSESVLVAVGTLGLHGYLFTSTREGLLQIGELASDGRSSFLEVDVQSDTTWDEISDLFDNPVIDSLVACDRAFQVLNAYVAHLKRGGKAARNVGLEILQPKPKEVPMVMQPKTIRNSPVDALLAQIQAAYDARIAAHTKRIAEFRSSVMDAIDTYAAAAEQDLLVDFAVRNQVENAGELRAGPAAEHLLELIGRLPELGGKEKVETPSYRLPSGVVLDPVAVVEVEDAPAPGEFATLQALINDGSELFIIGGTPVNAKLAWLEGELGLTVEWVDTENDPDARGCARIANKMRERGNVAGVLFCQSFMSHPQTQVLIDAGRTHGVPVTACGRGGKGEILRALRAVERGL